MCVEDNSYIFEIEGEDPVRIPPMTMTDLDRVLYSKMKPGKAPDIYHLTVEHLRNLGSVAKQCLLNLVNSVLDKIYYSSCPQVKLGISSAQGPKPQCWH